MTKTIISSLKKEVIIGFDQPFCVIGEKINPTNRPKFMEELKNGNLSTVEADAFLQIQAGADILDVNVGVPLTDEPALLKASVEHLQSITETPLCIDSSVIAALEAALPIYQGRALVNSVTGEEESLERILPLVKKYGAAVVAISNDETGISNDPDVRFEVAKKILHRAFDHGLKVEDIVVDPLVMPLGAVHAAGAQVFKLVRRLKEELKLNTTCGASNVGFGLPKRHTVTASFLAMAAASGMTSAIMSVTHEEEINSIRAANALLGFDENCTKWIRAARGLSAQIESSGGRRAGRENRRRRA
jgi:5-methyltetrahydrofolate--homocysteine methyltransferase